MKGTFTNLKKQFVPLFSFLYKVFFVVVACNMMVHSMPPPPPVFTSPIGNVVSNAVSITPAHSGPNNLGLEHMYAVEVLERFLPLKFWAGFTQETNAYHDRCKEKDAEAGLNGNLMQR